MAAKAVIIYGVKKSMKNKKYDYTFWSMALIFWLFWIAVTGSVHYQGLLIGAGFAVFIAWFNNDLLFRSDERSYVDLRSVGLYLRYGLHLILAIFIANFQVVALVLSPKMPIEPGVVRFEKPFKKSLNRVILANSITLTPGTLTIIAEEYFLVHALTRHNAENVVDWELADELLEIEEIQEREERGKGVAQPHTRKMGE